MPPVECCRLWPTEAAALPPPSSSLEGPVWSNLLRPPTQIPFLVRFQEERKQVSLPGEQSTDSKRCPPRLHCHLVESLLPRSHPGSSEGWSTRPPVEPLLPQVWSFNSVGFVHSRIIVKKVWFLLHTQINNQGLWQLVFVVSCPALWRRLMSMSLYL